MKKEFKGLKSSFIVLKNNRGDIGLKQIAITIGGIVIIGAIVSYVSRESTFSAWINQVWTFAWAKIGAMAGG